MFAGSSFRPMAQNVRLAQTAPAPTPPVAPPVAPVAPAGPVVVPIAPAPTPVVVTEPAPSYTNQILLVAAIAAGIAAVVMLSKDSKGY